MHACIHRRATTGITSFANKQIISLTNEASHRVNNNQSALSPRGPMINSLRTPPSQKYPLSPRDATTSENMSNIVLSLNSTRRNLNVLHGDLTSENHSNNASNSSPNNDSGSANNSNSSMLSATSTRPNTSTNSVHGVSSSSAKSGQFAGGTLQGTSTRSSAQYVSNIQSANKNKDNALYVNNMTGLNTGNRTQFMSNMQGAGQMHTSNISSIAGNMSPMSGTSVRSLNVGLTYDMFERSQNMDSLLSNSMTISGTSNIMSVSGNMSPPGGGFNHMGMSPYDMYDRSPQRMESAVSNANMMMHNNNMVHPQHAMTQTQQKSSSFSIQKQAMPQQHGSSSFSIQKQTHHTYGQHTGAMETPFMSASEMSRTTGRNWGNC
jgi:hypothetical protein